MLKLGGAVEIISKNRESYLSLISESDNLPRVLSEERLLLYSIGMDYQNFRGLIIRNDEPVPTPYDGDIIRVGPEYNYISNNDIARVNPHDSSIRVLFRAASETNSILLTERCNHYCLMCSQPPIDQDDSYLMEDAFRLIKMIPKNTKAIGFTGGEPTLYGQKFIDLISHTKNHLPATWLDVLSNGRAFHDEKFASNLASINHESLSINIPLYSDDPDRHNYIVQAENAFDETVRGIINLKKHKVRVEIRIVIHNESIKTLVSTCEFICRNLLFVDHVALMGLEITGFTRANMDKLWIDPFEYKDILSEAIKILDTYGMRSSVYNHQLCTVNSDVMHRYRRSISDWKNEYLEICNQCTRKQLCGGFFSSQIQFKHSSYIKPFISDESIVRGSIIS